MRLLIINCISDQPEIGLYLGLKKQGIDLDLILDPNDQSVESLLAAGISVQKWRIKHRFDFEFDKKLRQQINMTNYDCIYAPTSRGIASVLRVVDKNSTTRLVTYRGTLGNLSRFNPIDRLAHLNSRVSSIVCNCQAVKEFLLQQRAPTTNLPVVYKGHNPEWYQPKNVLSKSELSIAPNSFVVGCIANVRPLKGVDYLAQAINDLRDKIDITCLVLGKVSDRKLLRFISKNQLESNVRLLGFRGDVAEVLNMCAVTVMPSIRREGFPRSIVESYSNRIPVVCTNVGGMPEIVEHEKSGLVVQPRNAQMLAEALLRMYQHPELRKSFGEQGYSTVLKKLSLEHYVDSMLKVFSNT